MVLWLLFWGKVNRKNGEGKVIFWSRFAYGVLLFSTAKKVGKKAVLAESFDGVWCFYER